MSHFPQVEMPSDGEIMEAGSDTECAICRRGIKFRCTACFSTGYCSAECKDTDWPSHKVLCHRFKNILAGKPVGDDTMLVFCFVPNAPIPFLGWLTQEQICRLQVAWTRESGSKTTEFTTMGGINPIRQRPYRRPLLLMHEPHQSQHGIHNRSVESITGAGRESMWRGWVMAVDHSRDWMNLRDLRELADFFTSYQRDDAQLEVLRQDTKKVVAVRINCLDDVISHSLPEYEAVLVPKAHPVYLEPESCHISRLIGLPVKTFKYVFRPDTFHGENPPAAHLHRCGDIDSRTWGFPPQKWLSNTRSVLVVRSDGKHLRPEHAEVLCHFCDEHFRDIFSLEAEAKAYRSGSQEERQKAFRERASREGFEKYFEEYRSYKAKWFPRWRHIPTPYEMGRQTQ